MASLTSLILNVKRAYLRDGMCNYSCKPLTAAEVQTLSFLHILKKSV